MLPESIKKQIEAKYGHEIRYPKDCENLAVYITSEIKSNISASTLKRLFGFVKSESKPNKYTLDIIARFLDAENWEILKAKMGHSEEPIYEAPTTVKRGNKKKSKHKTLVLFVSLLLIGLTCISVIFTLQQKELIYVTEWKKLKNLPEVRKSGEVLSYQNCIFYLGGADAEYMRNNNWCYLPFNRVWKEKKPIPTPRAEMACVIFKGQLYCFGGWLGNEKGPTDIAEVYSIKKDKWDTLPPLPRKLVSVSAVCQNDRIYIIGGTLGKTKNFLYEFNPITKKYKELICKMQARIHFSLILFKQDIYLIGGNSFSNGEYKIHKDVDIYHLRTNKWESKPSIPEKVMNGAGYIRGNEIHIIGGKNKIGNHQDGLKNDHFIYSIKNETWRKVENLPFGICEHKIIEHKNQIYLLGGAKDYPNPSKEMYRLN
jgi:N-acetylneuraminic acid mutarotase